MNTVQVHKILFRLCMAVLQFFYGRPMLFLAGGLNDCFVAYNWLGNLLFLGLIFSLTHFFSLEAERNWKWAIGLGADLGIAICLTFLYLYLATGTFLDNYVKCPSIITLSFFFLPCNANFSLFCNFVLPRDFLVELFI